MFLINFLSCSTFTPVSSGGSIDSTDTSDIRIHRKVYVYDTVYLKITKYDTLNIIIKDTSFVYDTIRKSTTINDTTRRQVYVYDTTSKTVQVIKYDTTRKNIILYDTSKKSIIIYDTVRKKITLYDTSKINVIKYDTTRKSIVLTDTIKKTVTIVDTVRKTVYDTVTTTASVTKFGVLPHNVDIDTKIKIAKELGVKYVREGVLSWSGIDRNVESYQSNGFKIVYNISANGQTGKDFSKDTTTFKKTVSDVLSKYSFDVVAIENEEDNWGYHGRNTISYVNELKATIPVVHAKKIKVTNGGIHDNQILILAYRYYNSKGLRDSANLVLSFLNSGQQYAAQHPEKTDNKLVQKAAQTDSLLNYYKSLSLDYVNVHIYAPINDIISDSIGICKSVKIVGDYIRMRTGKQVMSNELGQHNTDPAIVNYMLSAFKQANYEYAIWFDGDGYPAMALNEPDGSLRANGEAFKNYPK